MLSTMTVENKTETDKLATELNLSRDQVSYLMGLYDIMF
jgi:hypothetical protein